MPVEIREIVLQARIMDSPSQEAQGHGEDPQAAARLKADILASCARMIREELTRSRTR
ncbi:DUF5908 family protein [Dinoroseobacter shibae]|jgi:hypothetical protein|uniref:DUF5908 family protein n=1 Tax=Dinoroseobacter shibae TaxID=215813 RepID=UPI0002DED45A|nr:DUF5908 family protein [Dinoroseobacter shibae]URF45639.1 DUF5908 family protein [Dinoroseobacter shibae]URF49944.1 DUF5908 family protein [Dinoroseobacter shibae]